MTEINLLPEGYKIKGSVKKLAVALKKFSIISVSLFIVTSAVIIALYIFYSNRVEKSVNRQTTLKSQIEALEDTEQKLILVKNRLQKVSEYQNVNKAYDEAEAYQGYLRYVTPGVRLSGIEINAEEINFVVTAQNKTELYSFFNNLIFSDTEFIQTGDIIYTQEEGFQTSLTIRI